MRTETRRVLGTAWRCIRPGRRWTLWGHFGMTALLALGAIEPYILAAF